MGFFQSLFHPHHHKGGKELNSHHNGSKSSPTSPLVMPSLSTPATTTTATSPACSVPQSPPLAKAQSFLSPLAPPQLNPPTPSASTFTNNSSSSKNSITSPTHSRRPSQDIPRFQLLEDGTHIHHLTLPAPNRITASLNGLVTGIANKSLRLTSQWTTDRKITLEEIKKERDAVDARLHRTPETRSLQDKWGTCHEVIGKGTSGVVKIARKADPVTNTEKLYAVKELRKRKDESAKDYITRLTSEFYMASTIHHPNIIQSYDLMPLNDVSPTFCQVMEFSGGGDLFDVLYDSPDGLDPLEANCFFKQLMRGVQYLHSVGVAHRDLKPENLLLTSYGCIKITDFGCAFCFQGTELDYEGNQLDDDDKKVHLIRGLVGSEPYIAPEEFTKDDYDARCVDVWSCGIIYMSMRKSAHLWRLAKKGEDESYDKYLKFRQLLDDERENAKRELSLRKKQLEKTLTDEERQLEKEKRAAGMLKARETIRKRAKEGRFDTLEGIDIQSKKIIYRMLDPQPSKRITAEEVLRSEWCENIYCCQPSS